jgi:hypothetical protein
VIGSKLERTTMAEHAKSVDMAAERSGIRRRAAAAFLLCAVVLGVATLWLPEQIELPRETAPRLAFAARASLLVMLWVAVGVGMVSTIRRYSAPDNPGSAFAPPSERLKVPLAFLQNTLEQATMTSVAFLALATVDGDAPLGFIMGAVVLFAAGRITFLRGYPLGATGRAFGMAMTALPTLAAFAWILIDICADLTRGAV